MKSFWWQSKTSVDLPPLFKSEVLWEPVPCARGSQLGSILDKLGKHRETDGRCSFCLLYLLLLACLCVLLLVSFSCFLFSRCFSFPQLPLSLVLCLSFSMFTLYFPLYLCLAWKSDFFPFDLKKRLVFCYPTFGSILTEIQFRTKHREFETEIQRFCHGRVFAVGWRFNYKSM